MDVNGTRFQLIQGSADWRNCLVDGQRFPGPSLWLDDSERLTLKPLLSIVPPPQLGAPLGPEQRRGGAADRYGHVYWIGSDERSLFWLPQGTRKVLPLWPLPATAPAPAAGGFVGRAPLPELPTLRGAAVTSHNYLVVGSVEPPGLLIFDLAAGAPPALLLLPDDVAFAPFDIASSADGGCWVLDRENKAYWGFDRDLRAVSRSPGTAALASPFQPVDGSAVVAAPLPVPVGFAVAAPDPIAIEGLPDGSVLILDGTVDTSSGAAASPVYRYQREIQTGPPALLSGAADIGDDSADGVAHTVLGIVAHDIAYDPDNSLLYAADRFGRQSLAFKLVGAAPLSLALQADYLPMHRFGGRALFACNANGTAAVSYDVVGTRAGGDPLARWARLQALDQPAHARSGVLETPVLDGKTRDCIWDALFLDACIPPGTSVTVSTSADNDPTLVAEGLFSPEPALYLRPAEAEIPYYDPFAVRDPRPAGLGTWELLFQRARGRFLKVRLELSGDGRSTPELRALRAYYPRFSYARQYLPAAYQEDAVSASFVERWLANPKGFYSEIEGKIRDVGYLFDPRSAPGEALDWLASWLGIALDPLWQDIGQRLQPAASKDTAADRRRLFIRFATRLFARRGTADGIRFALHLLLEPHLEAWLQWFKRAALTPDARLAWELARLGLAAPSAAMSDADLEDLLTQYLLAPLRPSKVRVVERFMTRSGLARVAGDPTESEAPSADGTAAAAHRFAVLIPETLPADVKAMVNRIVELEKPAHTSYEVRRYWDYFRVGEARLGIDTILGEDARFVPMLLGSNALAEGYLAYPPPMNAPDRMVLDRDPVGAMPAL